jgi:hypothetical protein
VLAARPPHMLCMMATAGALPTPDAFVPEHLCERLRWTAEHDAVARTIMREFNLQMPRDRELIRQLTFVRVRQGPLDWL